MSRVVLDFLAEMQRFVFGVIVLGGTGFVWWLILTGRVTASNELQMGILIAANSFASAVLGYLYGSSAGSAAKDRNNPPPSTNQKPDR